MSPVAFVNDTNEGVVADPAETTADYLHRAA
jgi:hypothetical protein